MKKLTDSQARKFNAFYLNLSRSEDRRTRTQNSARTILNESISLEQVILDKENYGAPPENSEIEINPKYTSYTNPQAWSDEYGNWYYNFPGAMQLAKELGRTLPNIEELIIAINANPDNFSQSAGYHNRDYDKFDGRGEFSSFWSSSEYTPGLAYKAHLKRGDSSAHRSSVLRYNGMSVRFITDKK